MHDVGAGVRLARAGAPLGVDLGVQQRRRPDGRQLAVDHAHLVHDQALDRALDVEDLEAAAVELDDAGVGGLAAGLGVERGAVEHELADLAVAERPRTGAPPRSSASGRDSVSRVS